MSYGKFVKSRRSGTSAPATSTTAIYVGRPSRWGNPFPVNDDRAREESVALYAEWVLHGGHDAPTVDEIRELLAGRELVCWCAPLLCHAHVLACIANERDGVERVKTWLMEHEGRAALAGGE